MTSAAKEHDADIDAALAEVAVLHARIVDLEARRIALTAERATAIAAAAAKGATYREIGAVIGVSHEGARQMSMQTGRPPAG
jgi:hypothetical protein